MVIDVHVVSSEMGNHLLSEFSQWSPAGVNIDRHSNVMIVVTVYDGLFDIVDGPWLPEGRYVEDGVVFGGFEHYVGVLEGGLGCLQEICKLLSDWVFCKWLVV